MKKRKPAEKFSLSTWKDYRIGVAENVVGTIKLSEQVGQQYRVELKPSDIDIIGEKSIVQNQNYDSEASDFYLLFDIDIEYRSWGIKGIYINATTVAGSVFINIWTDGEDETTEIDCSEFELETDVEITSDVISIQSLVVDVENRKIICS